MTKKAIQMRDGFELRRTAVEKRIPCFTSLDTARAAVGVLLKGSQTYNVKPVTCYRSRESS